MTNEIIFKTRVDTGNSVNDLKAVNAELKQVDTNTGKVGKDSAAQLEALNAKIAAGGMSARELSRSVNEYMTIARDAGRTSPIGQQAIAEAAKLTDELTDLRNEIKRASHDGANMQAALQLGGTLVAGYGVAQGAMAMLGVENEKLMQTMVKLQAATAVLNGIEQIRANLEKESFLMQKAKIVQTKVLTGVTAAYSVAVGTSTGALKLFRLALIATGIGAIVVAVGLLIANFDKVAAAVKSATERFNALGDGLKTVLTVAFFPFIAAIKLTTAALEALGVIEGESEKAARKAGEERARQVALRRKEVDQLLSANAKQKDSIEDTYDFEIAKAKAAGKDTTELEKQKRAELRKTAIEQLRLLQESMKLNVTNHEKMKQLMKEFADAKAAILKIDREEELAGITSTTEQRKKAAEQRKESEKKQLEEAAKTLERERLLRDYFIASIDDENVQKLTKLQEAHKREREELIKKYGQDTELLKQLEKNQDAEITALKKEFTDAANAKEIEDNKKLLDRQNRDQKAALQARLLQIQDDFEAEMAVKAELALLERDLALQNTELTENEKLLIEQKYKSQIEALNKETSDRNIELAKQERDQLNAIYEQGMKAVTSVTDAVFANKLAKVEKGSEEELKIQKKQFKVNKAMQLSAAVIDGFKSITASLAQSPIAIGAIPNPAGIASLAFATATSAANIAKIAATRFEGGSATPPDVQPPNIETPNIGAPDLSQGTSTQTAGLVNQPNKVVVVDSEIKAAMNQTEQIEVVSSFG